MKKKWISIFIPIYEKKAFGVSTYRPRGYYLNHDFEQRIYITVGNAYQFLKSSGTNISLREDKQGFTAEKEDFRVTFGDEMEVKLSLVKRLIEEPETEIELPPEVLELAPWLLEDTSGK